MLYCYALLPLFSLRGLLMLSRQRPPRFAIADAAIALLMPRHAAATMLPPALLLPLLPLTAILFFAVAL